MDSFVKRVLCSRRIKAARPRKRPRRPKKTSNTPPRKMRATEGLPPVRPAEGFEAMRRMAPSLMTRTDHTARRAPASWRSR